MGLEDYLVASVLRGMLAQRLVRRLCDRCKREAEAPPALVAELGLDRRPGWRGPRLWRPVGCPHCRNTGFRGRSGHRRVPRPSTRGWSAGLRPRQHTRRSSAPPCRRGHGDDAAGRAGRGARRRDDHGRGRAQRSRRGLSRRCRPSATSPSRRTGTLTRGRMEAPSEAAVVETLRRGGSMPMRTEPDAGGGGWPVLGSVLHAEIGRGRGALGRQELADLTRELAADAGRWAGPGPRPPLRGGDRRHGQAAPRRAAGARRRAGRRPLAAALAQQPRSFPPLFVGLVRAGEAGGTLAATLDSLADAPGAAEGLGGFGALGADLPGAAAGGLRRLRRAAADARAAAIRAALRAERRRAAGPDARADGAGRRCFRATAPRFWSCSGSCSSRRGRRCGCRGRGSPPTGRCCAFPSWAPWRGRCWRRASAGRSGRFCKTACRSTPR